MRRMRIEGKRWALLIHFCLVRFGKKPYSIFLSVSVSVSVPNVGGLWGLRVALFPWMPYDLQCNSSFVFMQWLTFVSHKRVKTQKGFGNEH